MLVATAAIQGQSASVRRRCARGAGRSHSDFTRLFHDRPDTLAGAAYLHNAVDNQVASLFDYPRDQPGHPFTGQRRGQFLAFLRSRLAPEPGAPYADQFLNSGIAPSKELLAVAADEIRVREQFVLLDEQKVAFDIVLHEVEKARGGDHQALVIVSGGPGSGKSIRETSANRWTKGSLRSGKAQVDELIDAARVPVFLLDEHQVVRPGESGTAAEIEKAARARGLDVYTVNLNAQYRCGGSEAYVEWVERRLGLRMGGPTEWVGDPRFVVQVAETPSVLEAALAAKLAQERGTRMAAG